MENRFLKVKNFLLELEYNIVSEEKENELLIVEKENSGIKNLVIDCEGDILILELALFENSNPKPEMYKHFLMMNREIIHGAIALDSKGDKVFFRDTLQLENLDMNELEGTLNSLELFLSENANDIINYSKN
ncbi:MAG: molecular chaperone Tir [Flavobacteriaceae bacterium]|nr:molecular chaperone Tir [Flavobacteriaceae bacterium]